MRPSLFWPCLLSPLLNADARAGSWIDDPAVRHDAMQRWPEATPRFKLDLDLPPEERWSSIYKDPLFKGAAADVQSYFDANLPKWAVPLVEGVAGDLEGHFRNYGREIRGVAAALEISVGTATLVNLVYALEKVGETDCTLMNTTGPCKKKDQHKGPGMCTSVVAEAADGTMWHGRNLDWNLPSSLRKYVFDVDFMRAGELVFRGTTVAGLVGAMHGMRPNGFSVSIDAREDGGSALFNILKFVSGEFRTASHLLREALETQSSFDAGLRLISSTTLVQPVYFIVAGAGARQGAVVARERRPPAVDVWLLNGTASPANWFQLQTNYDRWKAPPAWDDRRTPGVAHMLALGQRGVGAAGLKKGHASVADV